MNQIGADLTAVISSGARNLALSIFNAVRDSSSPAALPKITARVSFPRRRESSSFVNGPPPARG